MDDSGPGGRGAGGRPGRPIRSIGRAGAFIDDVGFALLLPAPGMALPSLYEAASEQPVPLAELAWGPDAQRVWGWKDALPRKALAWSGRLLGGGRASFLAPRLVGRLLRTCGGTGRLPPGTLGEEVRRIAETLLSSGPLPTAVLRQAVGCRVGAAVCASPPPWSSWAGRWCVPALVLSRSAPAGRAWCWS
jgi:hypothetical protein